MALQLEYELPTGVKANYWRILQINMDFHNKHATITVGLYKDKKAREADKQVLEAFTFDWYGDEFPFDLKKLSAAKANPLTIAYEKIRKMRAQDQSDEVPGLPGAMMSFKGARKA